MNKPISGAERQRRVMRALQRGHGLMWKNRDKDPANRKTENWPDYKGEVNVEGVYYLLDIWRNISPRTNTEYFSIKFKRRLTRNNWSEPKARELKRTAEAYRFEQGNFEADMVVADAKEAEGQIEGEWHAETD